MSTETENRNSERISMGMTAIIRAKENKDAFWKEKSELISLSRMGAGFYLKRNCQIGQLLSLLLPMPKHLRQYDLDKEHYRIWGVVQHCNKHADTEDFHIGVAFVGKTPPESYQDDPTQSYRIVGINEQGLWNVSEIGRTFVNRRHPRFWASLEIGLVAIDEKDRVISDFAAQTENISSSGAAVFSDLNVDVGDSLKFNCQDFDFSTMAIVRNRQLGINFEKNKLHLEFLDDKFPVEKLTFPFEEKQKKEEN